MAEFDPAEDFTHFAIVCTHVTRKERPILRVVRDDPAPDDPEDSGWQILCGGGGHDTPDAAAVWHVGDVVRLDPTTRDVLKSPPRTVHIRMRPDRPWESQPYRR
jgi:hypothetical protein